jgi:hypothetical protein
MTNAERIAEIKARLKKAVPSPWIATEGTVRCPLCDGEGDVDELTLDSNNWPVTVQVYGVGTDFKDHENFLHHAPADLAFLLSLVERQGRVMEAALGLYAPHASGNDWTRREEDIQRETALRAALAALGGEESVPAGNLRGEDRDA